MRRRERAPDDRAAWAAIAAGDPDAFGDLFDRHARAVYNHCFRRTADWSLAEDLTSVVFLEAWRRRGDVRLERETARAWLLGVATNVCRNQARARRRHRAALERVPPPEAEPDPADDVAGRLDDEAAMRAVLTEVRTLPRADQEVLTLCAWDGLTYAEAAAALGVPVGTVRSRLSRARRRLAGRLPGVAGIAAGDQQDTDDAEDTEGTDSVEPQRVRGHVRGERRAALRTAGKDIR